MRKFIARQMADFTMNNSTTFTALTAFLYWPGRFIGIVICRDLSNLNPGYFLPLKSRQ